jgi:hypothetical protein
MCSEDTCSTASRWMQLNVKSRISMDEHKCRMIMGPNSLLDRAHGKKRRTCLEEDSLCSLRRLIERLE